MTVFGALVGSFLNVVAWRLPRRESLLWPGSHCPKCDAPIRWQHNVPVLGWLALRGRCRDCDAQISPRYPIVELLTAIFFAGVGIWLTARFPDDWTGISLAATALQALAFFALAAVSVVLALIDIDTHTLPNRIVYPTLVAGIVLLGLSSLLAGDLPAVVRAAIGGALLFAIYLVMALAYPGGMGFGDVKLAAVLGFFLGWLGWQELAVGAFAPFLIGGLFGIALLAIRRAGRKSRIPFGPWMLGGAWIGILFGGEVAGAYLRLVGLDS